MSDNVNNPRQFSGIDFIGERVIKARLAGVHWRVVNRDGIPQVVTQDCNFNRYNFYVVDGFITKQYMG